MSVRGPLMLNISTNDNPLKAKLEDIIRLIPETLNIRNAEGRWECLYCKATFSSRGNYLSHLHIGVNCKNIRRSLGIPILNDKSYPCSLCGKKLHSKKMRETHELKCKDRQMKISQVDDYEENPEKSDSDED